MLLAASFRSLLVLAVGSVAIAFCYSISANAGPLEDCTQYWPPRLRLAGCTSVIESTGFTAPDRSTAYTNVGEIQLQAGAFRQAIDNFTQAIRVNADNYRAFAGRAEAYFSLGKFKRSIQEYDQAIVLQPSDSALYVGRGHTYLVSGNADHSIRDLTEALRLQPESASALNNRGLAYRRKGNAQAALADYNAAIAINPGYALAYANRGRLNESLGKRQEAINDLTEALRLDPSQVSVRKSLRQLGAIDFAERESDERVRLGRSLVEASCSGCHALGKQGASPNPDAPPFHDLQKRYQMLSLRTPITKAIAAPHESMPNFKPSAEEMNSIVAYINSLSSAQ